MTLNFKLDPFYVAVDRLKIFYLYHHKEASMGTTQRWVSAEAPTPVEISGVWEVPKALRRNLLVQLVLIVAALILLIATAGPGVAGVAEVSWQYRTSPKELSQAPSTPDRCSAKVERSTVETIAGSYRNTHHIVYLIMPERRLVFNYLADFLALLWYHIYYLIWNQKGLHSC